MNFNFSLSSAWNSKWVVVAKATTHGNQNKRIKKASLNPNNKKKKCLSTKKKYLTLRVSTPSKFDKIITYMK